MKVTHNFLTDRERPYVKEWVTDSYYLDSFGTDRQAFSATFKDTDLPPLLHPFKSTANAYHFVGIITGEKGAISEHIDEELVNYFLEHRGVHIRYPETLIYYIDVDDNMEGGQLLAEGTSVSPQTNMAIQIDPKTPHSVTSITESNKPRIVLVCERYKLLKFNLDYLDTPIYERG